MTRKPQRPRLAAAALLTSVLATAGLVFTLAPVTPAVAADGACTDGAGVTVVVDFTDIGGEIEIGCSASDPKNGRAALEAAGFTPTDSQPGMICAINESPNPCPETFDGSFWSYWHSTGDGEWTSYQVGADSSDPVLGEMEGWRYSDGSSGPGIAPAEVSAPETGDSDTTSEDQSGEAVVPINAEPTESPSFPVIAIGAGLGVAAIIVIVLFLLRSRRDTSDD